VDQLDLFEAVLNENHFNPETTQPRFIAWVRATGKRPGDPWKPHEFINWVSRNEVAFRKNRELKRDDRLDAKLQEEFTAYLEGLK